MIRKSLGRIGYWAAAHRQSPEWNLGFFVLSFFFFFFGGGSKVGEVSIPCNQTFI